MGFLKVVKSSTYFKRYQVKYRRRREGKTDYHRRKKLTCQDKNKYNSPKYRLVVRLTNRDVICQIAYAKLTGDAILAAAYSHELPRYGLPVGLTNYAACYATGLLLGRRLLKKLNLDTQYEGKVTADGELFSVEEVKDGPRPFRALLDVGLARTSTGARLFAALKGALDAGLNVPHSETRFRGYAPTEKKYNVEEARGYLFGKHIADFMEELKDEDDAHYQSHFARYIKHGINPEDLEELYTKVHAAIRKNPEHVPKKSTKAAEQKRYGRKRLSLAQRKDRIKQKLASKAKKDAQ